MKDGEIDNQTGRLVHISNYRAFIRKQEAKEVLDYENFLKEGGEEYYEDYSYEEPYKKEESQIDLIKKRFFVVVIVLGLTEFFEIILEVAGKIYKKKVGELTRDNLSLFYGNPIGKDIADYLKDKIIVVARKKGFFSSGVQLRKGIRLIGEDFYIINGDSIIVLNDDKFDISNSPVFKKKLADLSESAWINNECLSAAYQKNVALKNVFKVLYRIVKQWLWRNEDAAYWVTAAIMLLPFQHAMKWRPWILINGPTSSGKSLFVQQVLMRLYGSLIADIEITTVKGIIQALGNSSMIVVLDEFEEKSNIQDILNVMKFFNRGEGKYVIGSVSGKTISKSLCQMPVILNINMMFTNQAQANRYVTFELEIKENRTPPKVLRTEQMELLGAAVITGLGRNWDSISKRYEDIANNYQAYAESPRKAENYAYMLALLELCCPEKEFTMPSNSFAEDIDDERRLINFILSCVIKDSSVSELLAAEYRRAGSNRKKLQLKGLAVVTEKVEKYLVIDVERVQRYLLKEIKHYRDNGILGILNRIPGHKREEVKFGSHSAVRSLIPFSYLGLDV